MNLSLLEDSDRHFYPWNYVSAMMIDDFRTEVMRTAWKHRPKASTKLQKLATQAFLGAIHVKGFRLNSKHILRLAYTTVRDGLVHSMMVDAEVAAATIGLWAEAQSKVVQNLQESALEAGFTIREQWTAEMTKEGFYAISVIGDFYDFALNLTEETPDQWRNCLAALWLSSAFVDEEHALEPEPELEPEPDAAKPEVVPSVATDIKLEPTQSGIEDTPDKIEDVIDDIEANDIPSLADLNLSIIDDALEEAIQHVQRERQLATSAVQDLMRDVKHGSSQTALERATAMQTHLVQWEEAQTHLHNLEIQVVTFLRDELQDRPDLLTPVAFGDLDIVTLADSDVEPLAKDIKQTVEAIAAYDTQKDRALRNCQQLVDDITNLVQPLDNPKARLADLPSVEEDATLQVVRHWETQLRSRKKHLEDEIQSLRETLIDQINQQIAKLQERGIDPKQIHLGDNPDLSFKDIERRSLSILRTLRFILQTRMDDWIQQHTQDDRETVENVRHKYSADSLTALLEHLAAQERDVETLLVLLCTYAVQDANFDLTLSDAVMNSVLDGTRALSEDNHGFCVAESPRADIAQQMAV